MQCNMTVSTCQDLLYELIYTVSKFLEAFMSYLFKTYIVNGREYFVYGEDGEETKNKES